MSINRNKSSLLNNVRGWSETDVLAYLKNNGLEDFTAFCEAKSIDGYKLLSLSEGIVAVWRPRLDAKKLMKAIEDLKSNPERYGVNIEDKLEDVCGATSEEVEQIDCAEFALPKNIEAPKSFLYCPKLKMYERNEAKHEEKQPYLCMEVGRGNHAKDVAKIIESLHSNEFSDRGYYEMVKDCGEREKSPENPYEELNFDYAECDKKKDGLLKRIWKQNSLKKDDDVSKVSVIQQRLNKFKKFTPSTSVDVKGSKEVYKRLSDDKIITIDNYIVRHRDSRSSEGSRDYEREVINFDLYDHDHFYEIAERDESSAQHSMAVEDYLEPRQCVYRPGPEVMDSLAEEMMKLFDASKQKNPFSIVRLSPIPFETAEMLNKTFSE